MEPGARRPRHRPDDSVRQFAELQRAGSIRVGEIAGRHRIPAGDHQHPGRGRCHIRMYRPTDRQEGGPLDRSR